MVSTGKDSPWSVVIAVACCVGNFLGIGMAYSGGIYYNVFLNTFKSSPAVVSGILSINLGFTCTLGPIVSASVLKFGSRVTMLIGALLTSLGLALSALATSICWLYFSYGLLTGSGMGFIYQTSCTTVPMHFEKYRSVALGFVSAAAAVGQFFYPFIIPSLINMFGWRGSLLIVSGLILHVCVAAMILNLYPQELNPKNVESVGDKNRNSSLKLRSVTDESETTAVECNGKQLDKNPESMLQISKDLFRDVRFHILSAIIFLFMAGSSTAFAYLHGYAKYMGIEEQKADLLVSLFGGFTLVGRILLGMLGQIACVEILILLAVTFTLSGIGIAAAGFLPNFIGCFICAALFGFFYAASGPVYFEVICRLFDARRFTVALGYGMLIRGVGIIAGAPLSGLVYGWTSHFPASFYFGGSLCLLSGLLSFLLFVINIYQGRKPTTSH